MSVAVFTLHSNSLRRGARQRAERMGESAEPWPSPTLVSNSGETSLSQRSLGPLLRGALSATSGIFAREYHPSYSFLGMSCPGRSHWICLFGVACRHWRAESAFFSLFPPP